ncbi:hypothetical protein ACQR1W_35780 [Bradyrhizobium sp. HKCCYLS1011]|uniref:hypothetical protein n=1 Tax=Bradyrhizobium sp. HKCCYLS1011 TaxID=3420733 RepID=UPI003EBC034D
MLAQDEWGDAKPIGSSYACHGGVSPERRTRSPDVRDDLKFNTAIAFYPICSAVSQWLEIPTPILIGELDDWSPAKNCEQWMSLRANKGAAVKPRSDAYQPSIGGRLMMGAAKKDPRNRFTDDRAVRPVASVRSLSGTIR